MQLRRAASSGTARSRSATCRPAATSCARAATTPRRRSSPSQPISVGDGDVDGRHGDAAPGATISGTVVVSRHASAAPGSHADPDHRAVRSTAGMPGQQRTRASTRTARFTIERRRGRAASDSAAGHAARLDAEVGDDRRPRRHRHADRACAAARQISQRRRHASPTSRPRSTARSPTTGHAGHRLHGAGVLDRHVALASAVAPDHDGAAGPDRQVQDPRPAARRVLRRHRRSVRAGRVVRAGLSRRAPRRRVRGRARRRRDKTQDFRVKN